MDEREAFHVFDCGHEGVIATPENLIRQLFSR